MARTPQTPSAPQDRVPPWIAGVEPAPRPDRRRHARPGHARARRVRRRTARRAPPPSRRRPTAPARRPRPAPLASTADVPVGGGLILEDEGVVVTQPAEGDFKAFSAICTHQGCPVTSVEDGTITCPCHGSRFSIEDGSVQAGPAPAPLPAVDITVEGGQVSLA